MTKQVQRRRGTATQHTSFTGAEGEISVNTTNKSVHIHDGLTAGGIEAARADLTNVSDANLNAALSGNTVAALTITSATINGGTITGITDLAVADGGTGASTAATARTNLGAAAAASPVFTGQVSLDDGSAAAPSLTNTGDLNTGLFFPAEDTVGLGTGGTERLRVDASGNVGIGIAAPAQKLVADGNIMASTGDGGGFMLEGSSGIFRQGTTGMAFNTNGSERVRINGSGNVGIGTTTTTGFDSGADDLIVGSGSASTGMTIYSGTTGYGSLHFADANSSPANYVGYVNYNHSTNSMQFATGGTERMRIDASGNLGLGVTPGTWASGAKAMQISSFGCVAQTANGAFTAGFNFRESAANVYTYLSTDQAGRYEAATDGSHRWFNAPSGTVGNAITFTQAMTLDASGNLGIGTTSPASKLDVLGDVQSAGFYRNVNVVSVGDAANYIGIGSLNGTTPTPGAAIGAILNNPATTGSMLFYTRSSNALSERMRIDASGNVGIGTSATYTYKAFILGGANTGLAVSDNTNTIYMMGDGGTTVKVGTPNAVPLGFWTSALERMRIDASGNLLVGTTTVQSGIAADAVGVSIYGSGSGTAQGASILTRNSTNHVLYVNNKTSGGGLVLFYNGGNTVGEITSNGTTTSYTSLSDYRLKENVQPMQDALAKISQLNPVTYTWKADGSNGQGFIAHELQAVVPDCVTREKDAVDAEGNPQYQGVDTSFLVATLVKAIQELKAEVDNLRAQLNP